MFAVGATMLCKIAFTDLLVRQQQLTIQKIESQFTQAAVNSDLLEKLIDKDLFNYISINHTRTNNQASFENEQLNPIDSYLSEIEATTYVAKNGDFTIQFKAKNKQTLAFMKQVLLFIYILIIIVTLTINILYFIILKFIERNLIKELNNEVDSEKCTFSKFSAQLHEQKQSNYQALQVQEKQILQLAQQVNMDNLTGLNNRHAFRKDLTIILSDSESRQHAILSIIRASELISINTQRGFQYGDEYIVSIATLIKKVTEKYPSTSIYRISGSDFGIIARNMSVSDAQAIANKLKIQFDQYQALNKLDSIAYNGLSSIISGQLPEQVLGRTDVALAKAQATGINSWAYEDQDTDSNAFGQQHWRKVIDNIVSTRAITLLHQPILATHRDMKGYQELFTRFIDENKNPIPTDTVFAMAQRVDLSVKLEQLIMETVINKCRHKADDSTRWGVNVTSAAIQSSSFIIWLERLLLRESNIAASLVFEMQEVVLDSNLVASKRIFDMLKRVGSRSAICNFGKGIGSFRLFKELKPDFVKIDASLILNIERDSANQQFVRMIIDVAHRMDCRVIAEGIEHIEQKQILENMYIDGVQGYFIARPSEV